MSANMDSTSQQAIYPQVSVIVPVYNGEADLPDLLACLRSQTYPCDRVEYLLVDNNSSDRTAATIEQAIAEFPVKTYLLQEKQIQSSYAARNTGIRAATSDILAFTDADCRPQPDWLENLVQPFAKGEIGIVVGEIEALPSRTFWEKYAEYRQVLSQQYTLQHFFYPYGQTANLALRRETLQAVGLFRSHLTTGGDADLCWRIQQQTAWQLHFQPAAVVKHRHRNTFADFMAQMRRYGKSSRYLHDLYGIALLPELSRQQYLYRLARWLLKEIPTKTPKAIAPNSQTRWFDLLQTPISLLQSRARIAGQKEAKLPEKAKEIEYLE
ncbi:glycosyltransferase [Geitlerinema sp. PCC 9228]|uniref:glycosyltransferase n=1 Tax=Geitlerinema sp. PCC 9228 TaxID=111611 RepID=UPI0008F9CB00|nr:glycosyltransferase [Geitlerinema sp. PCC 9228]